MYALKVAMDSYVRQNMLVHPCQGVVYETLCVGAANLPTVEILCRSAGSVTLYVLHILRP